VTPKEFRNARHKLGLSANELAAKLGLSDGSSIRRYERGARPIPIPTAALMMVWAAAAPKPKKKGRRK
jgi:transcriptional regulator with XRE-family HTH domain